MQGSIRLIAEEGVAPPAVDDRELAALAAELERARAEMLALEAAHGGTLAGILGEQRESARNLLHYLALRDKDRRPLQEQLARRELSSLGRCEAHVLATVEAVLALLRALVGSAGPKGATPTGATCGSWSPCLARRPATTRWSATCSSPGWTACASTARTTTPRPGAR